jgi:hypothetical protein
MLEKKRHVHTWTHKHKRCTRSFVTNYDLGGTLVKQGNARMQAARIAIPASARMLQNSRDSAPESDTPKAIPAPFQTPAMPEFDGIFHGIPANSGIQFLARHLYSARIDFPVSSSLVSIPGNLLA